MYIAAFSFYKIFKTELEEVEAFDGFNDILHSFTLLRGKSNGNDDDDESRIYGKFKVRILQDPVILRPLTPVRVRACVRVCVLYVKIVIPFEKPANFFENLKWQASFDIISGEIFLYIEKWHRPSKLTLFNSLVPMVVS